MPFWSQAKALNWDSNYVYLRKVLPALIEQLPNWLWVVLWPDSRHGWWQWEDDGFFKDPRILAYPWPYASAINEGCRHFDVHRLRHLDATFAPTLYWVHQAESAAQLHGGIPTTANRAAAPRIVLQHHYIIHPSLPYAPEGMVGRRLLQTIGSLAAHRVVLNSDHTNRMMFEAFGQLLNDTTLKELRDKSDVLRFGLADAKDFDVPIHDYERPVVLYNHRTESYKKPEITAQVLRDLKNEGIDFEVWATQHVDQNVSKIPVDRIVGDPDYDKYVRSIAVRAVNTLNSVHETFCIALLDSIFLGHIPVAPNRVTFPELVPGGYPFLFENVEEQKQMLRRVLTNFDDEHRKWSEALRQHARKHFSLDKYARAYAELLVEESGFWYDIESKSHVVKGFDGIADQIKGRVPFKDVVNASRKATKQGNQSVSERRVVRELARRGVGFEFKDKRLFAIPR
jgi:glycosyltransferase involved in cell wall biosynthesis